MEIDDTLVSLITQELLKRLEQGNLSVSLEEQEKTPLILIGGTAPLSADALASLKHRFHILGHDTLEETHLPDNAPVLATTLSIQALTQVSAGDPGSTPEGYGLLWAILRGKTPFVLEEGIEWRRFGTTMPRSLYEKYTGYEKIIAGYGIKIIKEKDVVSSLLGKSRLPSPEKPLPVASPVSPPVMGRPPGKRVITETELMRLCPLSKGKGQTLVIGSGDILTPLALDYVTTMQISVCKST